MGEISKAITEMEFRILEQVQRAQSVPFIGALVSSLRDGLTGSESSAFVAARWMHAKDVVGREFEWVQVPANPEAGARKRDHKTAVVLDVGQMSVDLFLEIDDELLPAVAYRKNDVVHAGVLPVDFGRANGDGINIVRYKAAMREGRKPFAATMGLYSDRERVLYVPMGVRLLEAHVAIDQLATRHPQTPLA